MSTCTTRDVLKSYYPHLCVKVYLVLLLPQETLSHCTVGTEISSLPIHLQEKKFFYDKNVSTLECFMERKLREYIVM